MRKICNKRRKLQREEIAAVRQCRNKNRFVRDINREDPLDDEILEDIIALDF